MIYSRQYVLYYRNNIYSKYSNIFSFSALAPPPVKDVLGSCKASDSASSATPPALADEYPIRTESNSSLKEEKGQSVISPSKSNTQSSRGDLISNLYVTLLYFEFGLKYPFINAWQHKINTLCCKEDLSLCVFLLDYQ